VCHCYTNLTVGLVKSKNGGSLPVFKKGLPCHERYPQVLEEHFRLTLVPRLIFLMTEDEERKVRGAAVESVEDLVKELGPAFIDRSLAALGEAIMKLLESEMEEEVSDEE
jgi:hypothetical protein